MSGLRFVSRLIVTGKELKACFEAIISSALGMYNLLSKAEENTVLEG